jgi:hypothetical protein
MTCDIVALAKEYGVTNLRFRIPMRPLEMAGIIPGIAFKSSNTPSLPTLCKINEDRYLVANDYKITLEHDVEYAAEGDNYCGKEHFYVSDLESLISRAPEEYEIFVITIDGFQKLS